MKIDPDLLQVDPEVTEALAAGQPVVALESTIISHGLPSESSEQVARQIESAVRESGATPATIATVDGRIRVGLDDAALRQIAIGDDVLKASLRDLSFVLSQRLPGATTVAATAQIAAAVGIKVFATGGLGGVHRAIPQHGGSASYDESADLPGLANTPIAVVCAGVKSILDVPATVERLETLSIGLVGYQTDAFPGFYIRQTNQVVPWRLDSPAEIAAALKTRWALGQSEALIVANPIPAADEMARELHDRVLTQALAALEVDQIRGKDVTPYLLAYFHEHTAGVSLSANIALILNNARLASRLAAAL